MAARRRACCSPRAAATTTRRPTTTRRSRPTHRRTDAPARPTTAERTTRHRRAGRAPTPPRRPSRPRRRLGRRTPTTASIPMRPTRRSRAPCKIGSAMPLSGGAAAAAFAPVKDGFEAYIDYANEQRPARRASRIEAAPSRTTSTTRTLTPGAVAKLIDAGVHIFSGHHRLAEQRRRARHAQRRVHPAAERPHRFAGVGRGRRLPVDHRAAWCRTTSSRRSTPTQSGRAVPRRRERRAVLREQRVRSGLRRRVQGDRRRLRPRDRRRADDRGHRLGPARPRR